MYGDDDYIDNIFAAAYTPSTRWDLIDKPASAPVRSKPTRRPKSALSRTTLTLPPATKPPPTSHPSHAIKKSRPKSAVSTKRKIKRSPYMVDQTSIMKKTEKPASIPRLYSQSQPNFDSTAATSFSHVAPALTLENSLVSSASSHKRVEIAASSHMLSQTEIQQPYENEQSNDDDEMQEPSQATDSIPATPEYKPSPRPTPRSKSKKKSAVQTIRNMTRASLETPSDFPEFMELRENYIRQIIALEQYEMFIQESNVRSDISVSNFLHLLVCLRKVSFRIVDSYRKLLQFRSSANDIFELHAYIVKMATDIDCLNRQPFLNWMGISPILNPFLSIRRIDGSVALLAPPVDDIPRLKFLVLENTQVSKELAPTRVEIELADDLSPVVMNAYSNHQQALKRRVLSVVDADEPLDDMTVNSHGSKVNKGYRGELHHRRKEFFGIWRRTYLVNVGVRNLVYARNYNISRKAYTLHEKSYEYS